MAPLWTPPRPQRENRGHFSREAEHRGRRPPYPIIEQNRTAAGQGNGEIKRKKAGGKMIDKLNLLLKKGLHIFSSRVII